MLYCTASPFLLFTYFLFPFSFVYLLSLFCSLALLFTPPFFTHSLFSLVRSLFSHSSSLFFSLSFTIFLIRSLIFMFSFPSLSFPGLLALFFLFVLSLPSLSPPFAGFLSFVCSLPSLPLSPVCWLALLRSLSLSLPSLLFLVFYKL